MCMFTFGPSSNLSNSFIMLFNYWAFLLFSWLPYFTPKLFSFSYIRVFGLFCVIFPSCWYNFLSLFWNLPFYLCWFYHLSLSFLSFFIPQNLLFNCLLLHHFFLVLHFPYCLNMFQCFPFFHHFACFRSFLICAFSRISHLGFEFLFVLFKGTPIFTKTSFAPA